MHNGYERDEVIRRSGVNVRKCMRCGKCSGTCPAYDEMEYHPHQFVMMVENGNLEPLRESLSLYKCLSCFACVERCPRGVEPAKLVESVRVSVLRQKECSRLTPEMIPPMIDDDIPQQALVTAFRKFSL
jgi:heterodisulfide reductase subunit C